MICGVVLQQPRDIQDYDISFEERFKDSSADYITDVEFNVNPAVNTLGVSVIKTGNKHVKVWIQGGEDGNEYTVEIRASTYAGRRCETELLVQIGDFR